MSKKRRIGKDGKCAVKDCGLDSSGWHHYLPISIFGDNPFMVQLCKSCHKKADKLVLGKDAITPRQCFQIIYDFVNGMGGLK